MKKRDDAQLIEIEFEGQPSGEIFAWLAFYFLLLLALLVWGIAARTCSEAEYPAHAGGTDCSRKASHLSARVSTSTIPT